MVAVLIVVIVGSLNDWQKERQFKKLNDKKEDRTVKIIRDGKEHVINVKVNLFVIKFFNKSTIDRYFRKWSLVILQFWNLAKLFRAMVFFFQGIMSNATSPVLLANQML